MAGGLLPRRPLPAVSARSASPVELCRSLAKPPLSLPSSTSAPPSTPTSEPPPTPQSTSSAVCPPPLAPSVPRAAPLPPTHSPSGWRPGEGDLLVCRVVDGANLALALLAPGKVVASDFLLEPLGGSSPPPVVSPEAFLSSPSLLLSSSPLFPLSCGKQTEASAREACVECGTQNSNDWQQEQQRSHSSRTGLSEEEGRIARRGPSARQKSRIARRKNFAREKELYPKGGSPSVECCLVVVFFVEDFYFCYF